LDKETPLIKETQHIGENVLFPSHW